MSYSLLQLRMLDEAADRLIGENAILESHAVVAAISTCLSKNGNVVMKQFQNEVKNKYDSRFRKL